MMPVEITCALIGASSGILAVIAGLPLINWRIAQLEKKVDKHNNVLERMFLVEAKIERLEERMDDQCNH